MPANIFSWTQGVGYVLAGSGIGWLSGLSVSPVVATVLSSLLGLVGGVVAGFSAINRNGGAVANIWPVTLLILGISASASTAIWVRSHGVLGATETVFHETKGEVKQKEDISRRAALGVLYTEALTECGRLLGQPNETLPSALNTSKAPWAQRLTQRFQNVEHQRAIVEILCKPYD